MESIARRYKKYKKILLGLSVNLGNYFIIACLCVNGCYCYIFLLVGYIV